MDICRCDRENRWDVATLAPFTSEFVDSKELFMFEFQILVNKGINVWALVLVWVTVIWTGWSLLYFLCSERWRTGKIISKHEDSRRLSGSSDIQLLGCISINSWILWLQQMQMEESGKEISLSVAMPTQEPPTVWGSACTEVSGLKAKPWGVSIRTIDQ